MIASFDQWLKDATRNLPGDLTELVEAELSAHYEDALEDYTHRGYDPASAQQAALRDLGDPTLTAQGLHLIHLSRKRYYMASIACLLPLIPMFCVFTMFVQVDVNMTQNRALGYLTLAGFVLQSLMVVVCVAYGLKTFKPLLGLSEILETPRHIITIGLIALLIPATITQLDLFRNNANVMLLINDPFIYQYSETVNKTLPGIYDMMIGLLTLIVAFGWIMAGGRLHRLDGSFFFGLGPLLTWVFLISGFALLTLGFSILFDNTLTLFFATLIVAVGSPIKAALMAFLFFRAAYRFEPYQPLRA